MLIDILGWLFLLFFITILYRTFRYLLIKKKYNRNEIILNSKDIEHSGVFLRGFKYKK